MDKKTITLVFKSIASLMLMSASIHMVILGIKAVQMQDPSYVNFFNVLDVDFFFPQILQVPYIDIISVVSMVLIASAFFVYYRNRP